MSVGTMMWLKRSPVRKKRITTPASAPFVSHILLPLITHSSPAADGCGADATQVGAGAGLGQAQCAQDLAGGHRLEPLAASAPRCRTARAGRRPAQVRGDDQAGGTAAPADFLQQDGRARVGLPPAPPYCSGMFRPRSPSGAIARRVSQGNSPLSSTCRARGLTSFSTKS